ncbi:MAG: trehalose-6-phosphate synthase, partial [Acidobacteriota bacterium]
MTVRARYPFRLIVVSNRGPYSLHTTKQGLKREKTVGGLVTSLLPMIERQGGVWVAWGDPPGRYAGRPGKSGFDLRYIHLTPEQLKGYYQGFSNNALWPLCHYFLGQVHYDEGEWQVYDQVNVHFAQAVLEEARDGEVIWVHD